MEKKILSAAEELKRAEAYKAEGNMAGLAEMMGYGFTGDEAPAISLHCALKNPDNLKNALLMAVNHSGDSDPAGAITGNIPGLSIGLDTVSDEWISCLELKDEIIKISGMVAEL